MKSTNMNQIKNDLDDLCQKVRDYVLAGKFEISLQLVCHAMECYPHAPQPHNLMGIILEKTGDHASAMKHFQAAWALDSSYLPANYNLNTFGTFFASGRCAFDESDLPEKNSGKYEVVYNNHGIGCVCKKRDF